MEHARPTESIPTDPADGKTSEADIAGIVDIIYRHPRHREIYYNVLAYCKEERELEEVERHIESLAQFESALQSSSTLIDSLIKENGLVYREYDADGALVDNARVSAIREELAREREIGGGDELLEFDQDFQDALDDAVYALIARRTLRTTGAGAVAVTLLDPIRRIDGYMRADESRAALYLSLLEFCCEPRSLVEINARYADEPALDPTASSDWQRIKPSYLIDRMCEAGGLEWRSSWNTTEAGRSYLKGARP